MVVAKPMSPNSLYDRLGWIAFHPRRLSIRRTISTGPALQIEAFPAVSAVAGRLHGRRRRESGPALAQNDIDSLFTAATRRQS